MKASQFNLLRMPLLRGTNRMTWGRLSFALALVAVGLLARRDPSGLAYAADNPIVIENQQTGSSGWQPATWVSDAQGQIKGYASATSVNKGTPITFYVTVNPAQTFTIDIYRIGWYQGLGGRLLQHIGPFNGTQQPRCPVDATTGLIACNWSPGYILSVPTTWTSGIYLAVLTNAQAYQNYIIFVVRDDNRTAPLLYQQSVATYQAYNNYPNDGTTGKSLYDYNSYGPVTVGGGPQAVKVSFDRPYTGVGSGQFLEWEAYFVRWLERSGYDVTYSTDVDTHANGSALRNYKGFLSVGHDEYWSKPMRDAAEAARDAGVNLAFFGADGAQWQVRFEASSSGAANRVMVCYRDATKDPVQGATTTVLWLQPPVNRPEETLIGIRYTSMTQNQGYFSYTVTNSGHWVYAGSGFRDGDSVPGILGYETDHQWSIDPLPNYVAGSYVMLSRSSYTNYSGQPDWANSSIYKAPSGAWVFGAGTIAWSWGLDNYGSHTVSDSRIQQTTANLLNQFISSGGGLAGIAAPSNLTARAASITGINLAWTDNSSNEQNFVIERSTDQVNWSLVTSTWPANNTTYNDTVPSAGVYSYRVKATNTVTTSSYSNTATVDTQLPAPTGLSVMLPTSARVDLNWIDNATNETAYTVERSPDGSTGWTILTSTLPANTTSYSDTNVSSLTTYYYRVKATNGTNSSGYSNIVSVGTTNNVPPGSVLIYDEGLSPGWADWSYNMNRNFNNSGAPAFSGSVDLQAKASATWGAISLHFNSGNFSTSGFAAINFALESSVANQPIGLFFHNGSIALTEVDIRNYGGVVQNGWKAYSIPLSDLAAANTNIQNLNFQDWTGQTSNFPTFWLDKIYFSGSTSPPPPLPISTSSPPLPIYEDGVINGWRNWSWNSTENFNNNGPVFSGTNSIAFVVTGAWGGLLLHNDTAIDTSSYATLHFAAQATQPGQRYEVALYDVNNVLIKSVPLSNYGGDPPVGSFRIYDIGLADLNGKGKLIKGVQIEDSLGTSQPALYVDEIELR